MNIIKGIGDLWNSRGQSQSSDGPKKPQGAGKIRNFGGFIVTGIPTPDLGRFPNDQAISNYAESFADTIRQALEAAGVAGCDRLAIYLPRDTGVKLRATFATTDQMFLLEHQCEQKVFMSVSGGGATKRRVHVISRDLDFHSAFDDLLRDSVILRPLGADGVLVTRDTDQSDRGVIQLLVGVLEISRSGKTWSKQPIWAYKVPGQQSRIRVDIDFDLLVKGFPREESFYPIGAELNCIFRDEAGIRTIDDVAFDFAQATEWAQAVPLLQYRLVSGGPGGQSQTVSLRDYAVKTTTLAVRTQPVPDSYELSPGLKLSYNRIQRVEVGVSGRSITYTFAFFPTAVSYDPRKNVLRLRAQCIPATGGDVFFAPSPSHLGVPAFTLRPVAGQPQAFKLQIPQLSDHSFERTDRRGTKTPLASGTEHDVEIGDEITATPNTGGPHHVFKIQDLSQVPTEVRNARAQRHYVARVVIDAPVERCFELSESDHAFGSGRTFQGASSDTISTTGLKFHRDYLALKVSGNNVFYVPTNSLVVQPGVQSAVLVPPAGKDLELNADYELYAGDFQFFLNLTATGTATAAGVP